MPAGRPSDYTPELADLICERIANGESLRRIARDDGMPIPNTIMRWARTIEEFRVQYARAKTEQMDHYAEQLVDISDSNEDDTYSTGEGEVKHDTDHIQRAKLRIDTRKWVMARLAAKKYGDKSEQNVTASVTVTRLVFSDKVEGGEDE